MTVNVPLDGEADGEWISTAEKGAYDKDTPVIGNQAFTLVKYTKNVPLTEELLASEQSQLLAFIANFVGRGAAKQHNVLFAAEVEASGTEFKVFAADDAIASGEIEDIIYGDADMSNYLDGAKFVMRAATYGDVISLLGSARIYAEQTTGIGRGLSGVSLMGFPVEFSAKVDAITGGGKSVFFGNWDYLGLYERGNGNFTVLRDPFSEAATGQINFWYRFEADYEILQSEAVGYGRNTTT